VVVRVVVVLILVVALLRLFGIAVRRWGYDATDDVSASQWRRPLAEIDYELKGVTYRSLR
jgi:hypothetical protein